MNRQENIENVSKGLEKLSNLQKKAGAVEKILEGLRYLGKYPAKWTAPAGEAERMAGTLNPAKWTAPVEEAARMAGTFKGGPGLDTADAVLDQIAALNAFKKRQLIAGSGIAGAGALGAGALGAAALSN